MEENQQEILFQLSIFEQQIQQLQQQIQSLEQGIIEINTLNLGLNELKDSEGKEILAPIGRGIFVKSKILSEELTVDIGGKNFVKKTVSETQKLIQNQTKKLEDVKKDLEKDLEIVGKEVEKVIHKAQIKER